MATSPSTDPQPTAAAKKRRYASAKLARPLAPEEIRRGQYVAVFDEVWELPSFFWPTEAETLPRDTAVRVRFTPAGGGVPLRVEKVCLPFVLLKQPDGKPRTLDVRRCRLALLGKYFARMAWRAFRKSTDQITSTC